MMCSQFSRAKFTVLVDRAPNYSVPVGTSKNALISFVTTNSINVILLISAMPPRISPHGAQQPICLQCLRTRASSRPRVASPAALANSFHASSPRHTRLRRNMFSWLNGAGAVFRKPLPNSSNYLSAYDRQGNLIRANQEGREKIREEDELDSEESHLLERDREAGVPAAEIQRRAGVRQQARAEKLEREERGGLPKERASDLRPYPLNKDFRSQPVLSEDLRQRIYTLIAEQGIDLKSVSAAFGVDIRRVAAVVRLVAVEKQWVKEVSV